MTGHDRYLSLLKKSLLNELYLDNELRIGYLLECLSDPDRFDIAHFLDPFTHRGAEVELLRKWRSLGWNDNQTLGRIGYARTMIGRARLENVEFCVRSVLADGVGGDLIECGVWRGGSAIFMRGLLEALDVPDRVVWVADSFEGLPKSTLEEDRNIDLSAERFPHLAVSLEQVRRAFEDYELLDDRVRFLEGWFSETLPDAPIERLAILRLDGDLYESTRDALNALYDKVVAGGFVIVDDYYLGECRLAVRDFREQHGITEPLEKIDWTGVYWRKL